MRTFFPTQNLITLLFIAALLLEPDRITVAAESYQGAAAVLQKAAEQSGRKPTEMAATPGAALRSDLEKLEKTVSTLSAGEAVKQWLGLADRFFALDPQSRMADDNSEPIGSEQLLAALPPPTAWEELAKGILARPAPKKEGEVRELGLRLLAHTLIADKAGRDQEINALQARAEKASRSETYMFRNLFDQLSEVMVSRTINSSRR